MKPTKSSNLKQAKKKYPPREDERDQLLNFVSKFKDLIISASQQEESPTMPDPPKFHGRLVSAKTRTNREMRQSRDSRVVNYFNDSGANLDNFERNSRRTKRTQRSKKSLPKSIRTHKAEENLMENIDKSLGIVCLKYVNWKWTTWRRSTR
jgi:hypothetical protein